MEGCPKVLMISYDTKEPVTTEFSAPITNYIRDFYNEDPDSYKNEIQQINQLKKNILNATRDNQGCSLYRRYYAQLQFLQSRFPMALGGAAALPFIWYDVYTGDPITQNDIRYEQACVLYNLGGLYSQLGANESRSSDESMKVACTYFQCAAGAFQYLKENFSLDSLPDMGADILSLKSTIMLSQAQECLLEKSIRDNRKNTLISRISIQIKDYYQEAVKLLEGNGTSEMGSQLRKTQGLVYRDGKSSWIRPKAFAYHKSWKKYLQMKINMYTAIAYIYMSNEADQDKKFGEKVSYLKAASERMNEAFKVSKNQPDQVLENLKFLQDVVGNKLNAAVKDNDFVYHALVPDVDKLPEINGVSLVKAMPFQYNDPSVSGADIFQRLIPMRAHEASSLYSEEKASLLRKMTSEIEATSLSLSESLTSMHIDDLINPVDESLPESLSNKCKQLRDVHDIVSVTSEQIKELAMLSEEFEAIFNGLSSKLKSEEEFEREVKIGEGEGGISNELEGLKKEFSQCVGVNDHARNTNMTLCNHFEESKDVIELLCGPEERILASLPSQNFIEAPMDEPVVQRIRELLAAVEKMKNQRKVLEKQFREQLNKDDITGLLVVKEDGNQDEFFKEQLEKHDEMIAIIRQNLSAQDNILLQLTEANAKYATTRIAAVEVAAKRDAQTQSYVNHATLFLEVRERLGRGLTFYRDLKETLKKLEKKVNDFCQKREKDKAKYMESKKKDVAPPRPTAAKPAFNRASKPTNAHPPPSPAMDNSFVPPSPTFPPMHPQNTPPNAHRLQQPGIPPLTSYQNLPPFRMERPRFPADLRMETPSSIPSSNFHPIPAQGLPASRPATEMMQPRVHNPAPGENFTARFTGPSIDGSKLRFPSEDFRPRLPPVPPSSTMHPRFPASATPSAGQPLHQRHPMQSDFAPQYIPSSTQNQIPPQGMPLQPRMPQQSSVQRPRGPQIADMGASVLSVKDQSQAQFPGSQHFQQIRPNNYEANISHSNLPQGMQNPNVEGQTFRLPGTELRNLPPLDGQTVVGLQQMQLPGDFSMAVTRQEFTPMYQPFQGQEQIRGQLSMQPPQRQPLPHGTQLPPGAQLPLRGQMPTGAQLPLGMQQPPGAQPPAVLQLRPQTPQQIVQQDARFAFEMQNQLQRPERGSSYVIGPRIGAQTGRQDSGQDFVSSSQLVQGQRMVFAGSRQPSQQFGQEQISARFPVRFTTMQQQVRQGLRLPEPLTPERITTPMNLMDREDNTFVNKPLDILPAPASTEMSRGPFPHGFQKPQQSYHVPNIPEDPEKLMHNNQELIRSAEMQGPMTSAAIVNSTLNSQMASQLQPAFNAVSVHERRGLPERQTNFQNNRETLGAFNVEQERKPLPEMNDIDGPGSQRRLPQQSMAAEDPARGSMPAKNPYAFQGPMSSPVPERSQSISFVSEEPPNSFQQSKPASQIQNEQNALAMKPISLPSAPPMSTQSSSIYIPPPPFSPNRPFDLITMNNRPVMATARSSDSVISGILGAQGRPQGERAQQDMMNMGFQQFQMQQMILQQQQLISMIQNQHSQQKAAETMQMEKLQQQILDQQRVIEQLANEQHRLIEQQQHSAQLSHDTSQELLQMQVRQQQQQMLQQSEQLAQQKALLLEMQNSNPHMAELPTSKESKEKSAAHISVSQAQGVDVPKTGSAEIQKTTVINMELGAAKDFVTSLSGQSSVIANGQSSFSGNVPNAGQLATDTTTLGGQSASSSNVSLGGKTSSANVSINDITASSGNALPAEHPTSSVTNVFGKSESISSSVVSTFDISLSSPVAALTQSDCTLTENSDSVLKDVIPSLDKPQQQLTEKNETKADDDLLSNSGEQLKFDLDQFEEEMHAVLNGSQENSLKTPTSKTFDTTDVANSQVANVMSSFESLVFDSLENPVGGSNDNSSIESKKDCGVPKPENSPPFYEPMLDVEQRSKNVSVAPILTSELVINAEINESRRAEESKVELDSSSNENNAISNKGSGVVNSDTNVKDTHRYVDSSDQSPLSTKADIDSNFVAQLPEYPSISKDTSFDSRGSPSNGSSEQQELENGSKIENDVDLSETAPQSIPVPRVSNVLEEQDDIVAGESPPRPHLNRQIGECHQAIEKAEERKAYLEDLDEAVSQLHQQCMEFCKRIPGTSSDGFSQLWNDLAQVEELDSCSFTAEAGKSNVNKNRYRDILPWDHTRVLLNSLPNDYINANHIDSLTSCSPRYIATQGPIPQCFEDFWTMVWEQRCLVIVMLTNEVEGTKLKCHPYWPRKLGQTTEFGDLSIYLSEQEAGPAWKSRTFVITNRKTNEVRAVEHLQFVTWPDHGIPNTPYDLLAFNEEVRKCHRSADPAGATPLLLHCSAGVGRTGTFACIYSAIEEIMGGNGLVDVPGLIRKLRQCRFHMVQRKEQLVFCYQAILCYAQQFLAEEQLKQENQPHSGGNVNQAQRLPDTSSDDDSGVGDGDKGTELLGEADKQNNGEFNENGKEDSSKKDVDEKTVDKKDVDSKERDDEEAEIRELGYKDSSKQVADGATSIHNETNILNATSKDFESELVDADSLLDDNFTGRERTDSIPKFKVKSNIFASKSPPLSPGLGPTTQEDSM